MLKPQSHCEELVKALPREFVKAPPRAYLVYNTQVTQKRVLISVVRDLDESNAIATRRRPDGSTRWKHGQSSRQRKHRPASRPHGIKSDSQEGFNRRGVHNLMYKVTHKRVLIDIVHTT